MITTTKELRSLIDKALQTDSVGLDTEFVWERTYYPQLGLIQLALSNDDCHLIDPVAINDLSPLADLLASNDVVKILHDAPQDLAILQQATGVLPRNIFDTKLAAGFCGLSSTLSLGNLLNELLEIDLTKSETRTDWLQRPLAEKQVKYALDDVRYLRAARVVLLTRVYSPEVRSFLDEELKNFSEATAFQGIDNDLRYTKVKGAGGLSRKSLAILRELASWREEEAIKKDRPRGHIIQDKVLTQIAKNQSPDPETFAEAGLSPNAFKKYANSVVTAIKAGLSAATKDLPPSLRSAKTTKKEKDNFDKLSRMIKLKSDTKGIDPVIIGNASELKKYIKHLASPSSNTLRQTTGWRARFLEEFLI